MPRFLFLVAVIAALAGCGGLSLPQVAIPWVYKIDIKQGNVVTQEMLAKLKPGMDKEKVRFVLGTPLIVSAFGGDRWDYIYSLESGGKAREQRRISVFFTDDRLHHVEGDVVPHGPAGSGSSGGLRLKQARELPKPVSP
uniref:Outer membrane protein assembly factor BamE n=1 Tax=Candidatus Kentrum sp. DK TaxID=2126562 RepID=A0A450S1G2_9GAMM|nr:MAG: Beta-barrel assembly machine subunit BamE [Candidatus Kentron sp. DK]